VFHEKPKAWAGFDYSVTCPALALWEEQARFSFETCQFFVTMKNPTKKIVENFKRWPVNIKAYQQKLSGNPIEDAVKTAETLVSKLLKYDMQGVAFEGYAFGSKGRVFDIAESTAAAKILVYVKEIFWKPETFPPCEVKKLFSGKGNARKDEMHEAFRLKTGVNLVELLGVKASDSPVSDIVDSFAVLSVLASKV
jgi:Holliday junction resolvasome RuvABC endonuclease subunit